MNAADSRPGTQIMAGRPKMPKKKGRKGLCVPSGGESVDGRDCHVDRDIWSPVSVKVEREGCCTDRDGGTTGRDTGWRFAPYRLNLTAY